MDENYFNFEADIKETYPMFFGILKNLMEEKKYFMKEIDDKYQEALKIYIDAQFSKKSDDKIKGSIDAKKFKKYCEGSFSRILNECNYTEYMYALNILEDNIDEVYDAFFNIGYVVNNFNSSFNTLNIISELDDDSSELKKKSV